MHVDLFVHVRDHVQADRFADLDVDCLIERNDLAVDELDLDRDTLQRLVVARADRLRGRSLGVARSRNRPVSGRAARQRLSSFVSFGFARRRAQSVRALAVRPVGPCGQCRARHRPPRRLGRSRGSPAARRGGPAALRRQVSGTQCQQSHEVRVVASSRMDSCSSILRATRETATLMPRMMARLQNSTTALATPHTTGDVSPLRSRCRMSISGTKSRVNDAVSRDLLGLQRAVLRKEDRHARREFGRPAHARASSSCHRRARAWSTPMCLRRYGGAGLSRCRRPARP